MNASAAVRSESVLEPVCHVVKDDKGLEGAFCGFKGGAPVTKWMLGHTWTPKTNPKVATCRGCIAAMPSS